MDYMTLKEAAEKWGVTPRRVNYYCAAGRIPGAVKMAGVWLLPKIAEKPWDMRTTKGGNKMKIFIIEDEPAIREELTQLFEKYGYQCASSSDFQHIAETALSSGADLILLDINLPYQDGFQVCREIRQKSNLPIIVLTSRNSDFDELMSLNFGADDYISKPYNAQVLLARIQKLLARTYEIQDNVVLTHKGLTLNLLKAEISYQGQRKSLTKNEMGILRLLMVNKGNIIPRDAIIDELWQSEQFIDENTLNVNIVRLRKTLAEIGLPDYLETKRGLGYCV